MKKNYLLLIVFCVFLLISYAQEPTLTRKYLNNTPAVSGFKINKPIGARSCITLDNEISSVFVSVEHDEPGASNQLKAPEYFSINHFPTV